MSVNLPSLDQILTEAAVHFEDLTLDLTSEGVDEVVADCLTATTVTATVPTFAVGATMNLALRLESIQLPADAARHWSSCDQVAQAADLVLTELWAARSQARAQVLAAIDRMRGDTDA